MKTYYFTYGTDDGMPYYGGWTEIEPPTRTLRASSSGPITRTRRKAF